MFNTSCVCELLLRVMCRRVMLKRTDTDSESFDLLYTIEVTDAELLELTAGGSTVLEQTVDDVCCSEDIDRRD